MSKAFKSVKNVIKSVAKPLKKIAPIALPILAAFVPIFAPLGIAAGSPLAMGLGSFAGNLIGGQSFMDSLKGAAIAGATAGIFKGLKTGFPKGEGLGTFLKGTVDPSKATWYDKLRGITKPSVKTGVTSLSQQVMPQVGEQVALERAAALQGIKGVDPRHLIGQQHMGLGASVGVSPTGIMASQLPAEYAGANLAKLSTAQAMQPPSAFQESGIKGVDLTRELPKTAQDKKFIQDIETSIGGQNIQKDLPKNGKVPFYKKALNFLNPMKEGTKAEFEAQLLKQKEFLTAGGGNWGALSPDKQAEMIEAAKKAAEPGLLKKWGPSSLLVLGGYSLFKGKPEEVTESKIDLGKTTFGERIDIKKDPTRWYVQGLPIQYESSGLPSLFAAQGGSTSFPRKMGYIQGQGTGKSDSIPAMLSNNEFVFTENAVKGAGGGSVREGAKKMYAMMHNLEQQGQQYA